MFKKILTVTAASLLCSAISFAEQPVPPNACPSVDAIQALAKQYSFDFAVKTMNNDKVWMAGYLNEKLGTDTEWNLMVGVEANNMVEAAVNSVQKFTDLQPDTGLQGPFVDNPNSDQHPLSTWSCFYPSSNGGHGVYAMAGETRPIVYRPFVILTGNQMTFKK
jgi:hypothetical protein